MKKLTPPPEFSLFPFKAFRPNPPFLEGTLGKPDPWAARYAWRQHETFSFRNRVSQMAPGLGVGSAAFIGYVLYDNFMA
jgi:hypothetical protein